MIISCQDYFEILPGTEVRFDKLFRKQCRGYGVAIQVKFLQTRVVVKSLDYGSCCVFTDFVSGQVNMQQSRVHHQRIDKRHERERLGQEVCKLKLDQG